MDSSDLDDYYDSDQEPDYLSSDGEMDFVGQQPKISAEARAKSAVWGVIDKSVLAQVQDESLAAVQGILGFSRDTARKLLTHFQWDKEALFGTLADRSEEAVYKAAGVTSRAAEPVASAPRSGDIECGCCFCEVPVQTATTMECGHTFCNDCWVSHFTIQISEGNSRRLLCMAIKCGAICDDRKVVKLMQHNKQLVEKYQQKLLESYIEDNKQVKWCPSVPHCGCAIQVDGDLNCEPTCRCGKKFCFQCGHEPHAPCTCDIWTKWLRKCSDDSETANWLNTNTKPCPKCRNQVEKNGGCNLVVCRCGQAFCWLCGTQTGRSHTWETISGHSCGRYKEDADKKIDEAQRNLKRYIHYNSRWEAQVASQKLEGDQLQKTEQKISELEENMTEVKDYTWLMQAQEQLFCARRILGNTYVAAYYFYGNDMFADEISAEQNAMNQNLFEDQQQQLEMEVDRLSKLTETPVDDMNETKRLQIINSTVNVDKRLVKLFELIETDLLAKIVHSTQTIAPYKGVTLGASTPQQSATLPSKYSLSEDSEAAVPASTRSNTAHEAPDAHSSPGIARSDKRPRR